MDYAADKYPRDLIEDTKILMNVLYMFLPLPLFWALYDQTVSPFTPGFPISELRNRNFYLPIRISELLSEMLIMEIEFP